MRGICVLIVNTTGLKFSYSTSRKVVCLTLFSASEIVYVLPLRSNIIPSNDSSLSYSFWISLNRFSKKKSFGKFVSPSAMNGFVLT